MKYPIKDPEKMYRNSSGWDCLDDFLQGYRIDEQWEPFYYPSEFQREDYLDDICDHVLSAHGGWMEDFIKSCRLFRLNK